MNNDLISIIIPVYNSEQYIENCIKSVLEQTYKNLEIIIINDGSVDSSLQKCQSFKDSRIKIVNKKNEGLSVARNEGIKLAKGKYINFIDSDDIVEKDYIEYLYKLIKKYEVKMSICSYKVIKENGKVLNYGNKYNEELLNTKQALSKMLCEQGFNSSAWAKLYEKDLFKNIEYPKGKICEDLGTTYKLIMNCKFIAYGNEEKYYYYKRSNSIINSQFSLKRLDVINLSKQLAKDINAEFPNLRDETNRIIIYSKFSVLRQVVNSKKPNKKLMEVLRIQILKQWKQFFTNSRLSKRDKYAFVTLLFGNRCYRFCWNLYSYITYGK